MSGPHGHVTEFMLLKHTHEKTEPSSTLRPEHEVVHRLDNAARSIK